MSAVPANNAPISVADADFTETREWMDALSAVIPVSYTHLTLPTSDLV